MTKFHETRMQELFKLKKLIQKLEAEKQAQRKIWIEAAEKVRSIGQQIADKKQELIDGVEI